ncbi:methyl-accepting chemotaxis protein [Massilia sp. CMS3.1]|uniref:methyl-accepting chemotaxis protein n=1 Tax=Massilia sp. CMS3.1 TaxID=3373083 RepID=UPI003EE72300
MKNLKIGAKLGIGFAIVLTLLFAVTTTAVLRMMSASANTRELVNISIKNQRSVAEWAKYIELNSAMIETVFVSNDPGMVQVISGRMKNVSARSTELQKKLEASVQDHAVRAQLGVVMEERKGYLEARGKLFAAKLAGDNELASKIHSEKMVPRSASFLASMNKLQELQVAAADSVAAGILEEYVTTEIILVSLGLAALILGSTSAWLITRSITKPISEAVTVAEKVAAGDLTSKIIPIGSDETAQLMRALAKMNANLSDIVGRVRAGTSTIAVASNEIAAGNQDLSSRTEQQASSLEETALFMEELTSTVKQNSSSAYQGNKLAQDAGAIASNGGAVVAEVIDTMSSINYSSKKIVDIISVIDSIAFQTNILALNAAVEAARAGEQGRGFAVVATEVRNLAHRSAAAAKEIKILIEDTVSKVEKGTSQVGRAGTTMNEIVMSIQHVTAIMGEIASASEEQSAGIEQVNQAITEMDRVTQQNAALVEEGAAAAELMKQQANRLIELVSTFKIGTLTNLSQSRPGPALQRAQLALDAP